MKLYFTKGACSLVVRIIINEIGLSCEYESVDLRAKKTITGADYWQINPKGSVPALEIKHGELLTENAVILQYLADTHPDNKLLPKMGDFNRYRVLEWLNYITTELHKGFAPLFNPSIPQDVKENIFVANLKVRFVYINKQLQGKSFLLGDNLTLPDAYLFVMLRWARAMKIDFTQWENLATFYNGMLKRKSIVESLKQEELELA